MLEIFSENDIRDLRENPTDHTKLRVVDKLARTLNYQELTADERQVSEQILRLLAADISNRIRIAVSEKFSGNDSLPYDVAVKLANDIEDFVAIPMLQFSQILQDKDLLEILDKRDTSRQSAVARRHTLNDNISQAIIAQAAPEAVEALIENEAVQLSPEQTSMIMQRFDKNEGVLKHLVTTNRVNLEQAHDLIAKVSEELRKVIIVKYEIPASTVSNLVQDSREWVILSMLRNHADKTKKTLPLRQIIERLHSAGELSFTIIIKSLTYGDFDFFCGAVGKIADIPEKNVQILLESNSEVALEGLFKKAGFPMAMLKATSKLIEVVNEEKAKNTDIPTLEKNIIQQLIQLAEKRQIENIGYLVTIITHYSKF